MADNLNNPIDVGQASRIEDPNRMDDGAPIASEVAKNKKATIQRSLDTFNKLRDWRHKNRDPVWHDVFNLYHGNVNFDPYPYASAYVVREIFRQIESLKPQMHFRLLGARKKFELEPRREGDEEYARAASGIMHFHLDRLGINMQNAHWLSQCPLWGVSYLRYGWTQFKRFKQKLTRQHYRNEKKVWVRKTDEITEEGPFAEWVHHRNVYTFPDVDLIEESPAVYVREIVSAEYIKSQIRQGLYDETQAKLAVKRGGHVSTRTDYGVPNVVGAEISFSHEIEEIDELFMDPDELHILTTCWTNGGWVYEYLNDEFLVRARRNVFSRPPILALRNYVQPGWHYGLSEVEIMAEDQYLVNTLYSLFVDTIHFGLQPMFLVNKDDEENFDAVSFQPGTTIPVNNVDNIRPLEVNAKVFEINSIIELIKNNMAIATGVTPELTGSASRSNTATVHVKLQEAASSRLEYKLALFEDDFKKFYRILYDLEAAFLDTELALRLEGPYGRDVFGRYGPEAFAPDVDITINMPRTTEVPMERQQRLIQLYSVVAQDPNWETEQLIEEIGRAFEIKNPRRLIANGMEQQEDAVLENQDHMATGIARPVRPSERHDVHAQIHLGYINSPEFKQDPETGLPRQIEWQSTMQQHIREHMNYVEQAQAANSAAQQAPMLPGSGSPVPGADAQTELLMGNAATGAAQAGAPPPVEANV